MDLPCSQLPTRSTPYARSKNGARAPSAELWLNLGDGVNQAADFFSDATSIPSRNVTPLTTFGN
jgi:hypothetical protein